MSFSSSSASSPITTTIRGWTIANFLHQRARPALGQHESVGVADRALHEKRSRRRPAGRIPEALKLFISALLPARP